MLRSHVSHNLKANLSPPEMTLQILIEICSTIRSYSSPQHDIGHDLYLLNNQWYNILNLLSFRGIRSLQNKRKQNPMSLSQPSAFFQVLVDHLQVVPLAPAVVVVCVCVSSSPFSSGIALCGTTIYLPWNWHEPWKVGVGKWSFLFWKEELCQFEANSTPWKHVNVGTVSTKNNVYQITNCIKIRNLRKNVNNCISIGSTVGPSKHSFATGKWMEGRSNVSVLKIYIYIATLNLQHCHPTTPWAWLSRAHLLDANHSRCETRPGNLAQRNFVFMVSNLSPYNYPIALH